MDKFWLFQARLGSDDLSKMTKEELIQKCLDQEAQIDTFLGEGNENPGSCLRFRILNFVFFSFKQLQEEKSLDT